MNHFSQISKEFSKHAIAKVAKSWDELSLNKQYEYLKKHASVTKTARKWDDLSYDEQRAYLKRHPKSKRKITARPSARKEAPQEDIKKPKVKPSGTSDINENTFPFLKYYTRESARQKVLSALSAAQEAVTSGTAYFDDLNTLSKLISNDPNLHLDRIIGRLDKRMSKEDVKSLSSKLGLGWSTDSPKGVKQVWRFLRSGEDLQKATKQLASNIAAVKFNDNERPIVNKLQQVLKDYKPLLELHDKLKQTRMEKGYRPKEKKPIEVNIDQPLEKRYPFVGSVETHVHKLRQSGDEKSVESWQHRHDKLVQALEVADESLQEGQIFNIDYKELKDRISSAMPKVEIYNLVEKHGGDRQASPDIYFYGLNELPKAVRTAEGYTNSRNPAIAAAAKEWLEIYQPFLAARELLKQLKPMIVKGRKPDPNAPEKYVPPAGAIKDLRKVNELLTGMTDNIRKRVIDSSKRYYRDVVDTYINETNGMISPHEWAKEKRNNFYPQVLNVLVHQTGDYGKQIYKPIDAIDKRIDLMAERDGEAVLQRFIAKNTDKLASIIGEKGGLKQASSLGIQIEGHDISGKMRFKFDDGSMFDVWSSVVLHFSSGGRLTSGQPFYRYPTTFHNIVTPNGETMRAATEEWMNETFTELKTA